MFTIRPATPADLGDFYRICLETGDSGLDATGLYADPQLLGHVYAAPYLLHAPDFAFVLQDEAGAAGYVIGVPDSQAFEATLDREWWPALRERYPDPAAIPPAERSRDQRMMHLIHHPHRTPDDLMAEYPAHLHIDLLPRAQGGGNGRRMMDALFGALRQAGVPGVHLGVGARNERAQAFYRRLGFTDLSRGDWGATMGLRFTGGAGEPGTSA